MKKISLKNIKETLTRAEMKAINGGSENEDGDGSGISKCGNSYCKSTSFCCQYMGSYRCQSYYGSLA